MPDKEVIPERVIDVLRWHNRNQKELLDALEQQVDALEQIKQLVLEGLETDGAHHKQWFLAQIGVFAGLTIDFEEAGAIAP